MRRTLSTLASGLVAASALASLLPAEATAAPKKLQMFGLTADQQLIRFREDKARSNKVIGPITNLSGDSALVGIDFRPANGSLYALGNQGGIYTLDVASGEATLRAQTTLNGQPLTPTGTSFGVDFNPTVDRLRVVSNTGQNLRINVDTGAATQDADLNAGTPPVTATGVTGVGYTNNDADPGTGTTLFDLDSANDQVVIQLPPNAGNLTPTGKLGQDVAPDGGFDIWSDVDESGRSVAVRALAALTTDASRLYEIDLLTGQATNLGRFRGDTRVIGLAIALDAN